MSGGRWLLPGASATKVLEFQKGAPEREQQGSRKRQEQSRTLSDACIEERRRQDASGLHRSPEGREIWSWSS